MHHLEGAVAVSACALARYASRSLCRIGYDNIEGYLAGGLAPWYRAGMPVEHLNLLSVEEMEDVLEDEDFTLLDVRNLDEWSEGRFERAINIYLGHLKDRLDEVPRDKKVVTICKAGTRASIAASILLRDEREGVYNLLGGMDACKKAGYPIISDEDE